jgi:hypothetical protein
MTVPIVGREARSTRRLRLLNLIARASEELMSLERADRRGPALNIVEPASSALATPGSPQHMREWAREQGLEVGNAGRLPATIRDAYEAAHTTEETR